MPMMLIPGTLERMTVRDILEAALKLKPHEREMLVEELSRSLHGGFANEELEQEWMQEIERRSQEIDSGTAELVEWSDVRQRLAERRARRSG
jgi:putative addiction module component (TIGR02574 family)